MRYSTEFIEPMLPGCGSGAVVLSWYFLLSASKRLSGRSSTYPGRADFPSHLSNRELSPQDTPFANSDGATENKWIFSCLERRQPVIWLIYYLLCICAGSISAAVLGHEMIIGIQYLRFLAAFLVLLGHSFMEAHQQGVINDETYLILDRFPWGAGVDVFFIVSGFIIHQACQKIPAGRLVSLAFFRKRLFRIVPLYWAFTGLMLLAFAFYPAKMASEPPTVAEIVSSLFFVPRVESGQIRPVLAQGWTLDYEMFFYLLASLSLVVAPARRTGVLVGLVVAAFAAGTIFKGQGHFFDFLGYSVVLEFAVGVGLSVSSPYLLLLPSSARLTMIFIGAAGLLVTGSSDEILGASGEVPRFFCEGLPSMLIVAAFISHGLARQAMSAVWSFLGGASYALYLSHPFVINGVDMVLSRMTSITSVWLVATISSSIIFAVLFHWKIEGMINRFAKRMGIRQSMTSTSPAN